MGTVFTFARQYITKPIRNLTEVIERLAKYDFSFDDKSVDAMEKVSQTTSSQNASVESTSTNLEGISATIGELRQAIGYLNEDVARSSESLAKLAEEMQEEVAKFKF